MVEPSSEAQRRRREIQAHAASLGIDEVFISELVDTFYRRVRANDELGPIFETAIGDKWDHHLAKLKDFWASVALNAGTYSGQPVPVHRALTGVEPALFDTWLALFRQTLDDIAPSDAARDYFMERASRIARSLKLAMFRLPGLPEPR